MILLSDTNCDELCTDTKHNMTNLLESMYCNYQFKQTIETSTCVTDKTSTLIDHFATNRPSRIVKIGIVITGFSDQHMVFGMRKISGNRNTKLPKINNSFRFEHISAADALHHVSKLKSSRSGAIPTRFIKDGINEVANSLSILFNRSIEEGSFPSNLKIASLCPTYKGEGHKDNLSNYRPISILPIIAEVFEKLMHNQPFRCLESTSFKYQSGFRPKHSTEQVFSIQQTLTKEIITLLCLSI